MIVAGLRGHRAGVFPISLARREQLIYCELPNINFALLCLIFWFCAPSVDIDLTRGAAPAFILQDVCCPNVGLSLSSCACIN